VPVVVAAQTVQGGVAGEAVDQLPDAEFGQPRQHRCPIGERRDRAGAAVFAGVALGWLVALVLRRVATVARETALPARAAFAQR